MTDWLVCFWRCCRCFWRWLSRCCRCFWRWLSRCCRWFWRCCRGFCRYCGAPEESEEPAVPAPRTSEERDYLTMMYEEHAEHMRQHETLRAAVTGFFIALIAGLLAAPGSERHPQREIIGGAICVLSFLGLLLNEKHYERYLMHRSIVRGFRKSLEKGLSPRLRLINRNCRDYHENKHPILAKEIGLHELWRVVYMATLIVGIVLIVLGWTAPADQPNCSACATPAGVKKVPGTPESG
jgi:hypothetical protein